MGCTLPQPQPQKLKQTHSCVCIWGGGWGWVWDPLKKPQKARKSSFCGWVLCINELYPTTTSTTKAKINTLL